MARVDQRQTLLAILVRERRWTIDEFCARYAEVARRIGLSMSVSERQTKRWFAGELSALPHPAACRVLENMFGRRVEELLQPPGGGAGTRVTWTAAPGPAGVRPDRPASRDVERQVAVAARRAGRFLTVSEASNVGRESLDDLRDEVGRLARAYPRHPLPTLLDDLVDVQERLFDLVEGRQRSRHSRELYLLAGAASGMLATASQDVGAGAAAMTHARAAYSCADNTGHDGLRAWVRGLQSLVAYWADRPRESVRYARLGAEIAGESAGTAAVWLPALEARAWAAVGDTGQARAAVDRASADRDAAGRGDLDQLGGLLTFDARRQLYYTADTFSLLPDVGELAARTAEAAVLAYDTAGEDISFGDEAGARLALALARLGAGELDGARQALRPVLDLAPERRIGGIVAGARRVHRALQSDRFAGSVAAREAREEIEAFCRFPLAAAGPG